MCYLSFPWRLNDRSAIVPSCNYCRKLYGFQFLYNDTEGAVEVLIEYTRYRRKRAIARQRRDSRGLASCLFRECSAALTSRWRLREALLVCLQGERVCFRKCVFTHAHVPGERDDDAPRR